MEKIARSTGEDEFDLIILLQIEKDIWVTKENLDFPLSNLKIFYVIEPFVEKRLKKIRNRLKVSVTPLKLENFIVEIKKHGKNYMKYPFVITRLEITENIYEDLVEEHGINLENYSLNDWEYIRELWLWKECENQVTRELIALKLCEEMEVKI